jgi:hypothetical protein
MAQKRKLSGGGGMEEFLGSHPPIKSLPQLLHDGPVTHTTLEPAPARRRGVVAAPWYRSVWAMITPLHASGEELSEDGGATPPCETLVERPLHTTINTWMLLLHTCAFVGDIAQQIETLLARDPATVLGNLRDHSAQSAIRANVQVLTAMVSLARSLREAGWSPTKPLLGLSAHLGADERRDFEKLREWAYQLRIAILEVVAARTVFAPARPGAQESA